MRKYLILIVILFPLSKGTAQTSEDFYRLLNLISSDQSIPKRLFKDSSCYILINKKVKRLVNEKEVSEKEHGVYHLDSIVNGKFNFYLILFPGAVSEHFIVLNKFKIKSKAARVNFAVTAHFFNGIQSDYKIFDWTITNTNDNWKIKSRREKSGPWSYPPIKRMPK